MANVYITKPLRKFTNQDKEIKIDADSYLNLYTNLVNIYPELRKCVKDIYDTKSFDFWFIVDGKILPYEEFLMPIKKDSLVVFVPLIFGSGDDFLAIGIGIALIAITILTFGTAAPFTALAAGGLAGVSAGVIAGAIVGQLAFSLGLSLVLSGVMSVVTGSSQKKNANTNDSSARAENDAFGSLQNTTTTDTPIPLIFGQMRVAGQFVGGRIKTINHNAGDVISLANYTI